MIRIEFTSKTQSGCVTLSEDSAELFLENLRKNHRKYNIDEIREEKKVSDKLTVKTSKA